MELQYPLDTFSSGAYKKLDGKKFEGRRCVVDVERGRTVKDWLPRRLGWSFALFEQSISL